MCMLVWDNQIWRSTGVCLEEEQEECLAVFGARGCHCLELGCVAASARCGPRASRSARGRMQSAARSTRSASRCLGTAPTH